MPTLNFKCSNIAGCDTALNQQMIELDEGAEQLCPECKSKLMPWSAGEPQRPWMWAAMAAAVLVTAGVGAYLLASGHLRSRGAGKTATETAAAQAPAAYSCGMEPAQPADVGRLLEYLKQGMNYATQKRPDLALTEFKQVLKIDPNFLGAQMNIGVAHLAQNRYPEAEASFNSELKLIGCLKQMDDAALSRFAYMEEAGAKPTQDKQQLQAAQFRAHLEKTEAHAHYNLACLNARRRMKEAALEELEKAMAGGMIDRKDLQSDPDLNAIRATDGFKTLMERYSPSSGGSL
jgi:tetratricopeptide (TPR) repeat protein